MLCRDRETKKMLWVRARVRVRFMVRVRYGPHYWWGSVLSEDHGRLGLTNEPQRYIPQ